MVSEVYKKFRPARAATAAILLLVLLFTTLGTWQLRRAAEKQLTEDSYRTAESLPLRRALAGESRFSRITATGVYDQGKHILLDNRLYRGRAGVHVFTPFYSNDGTTLLVNRGWLPLPADRKNLPEIPTPPGEITLKGMLNLAPVPGRALGAADHLRTDTWPQLVTYLVMEDISSALGVPLETWIVQLAKSDPNGFEDRDWKPVYLSSDKHRAYAVQWFALTLAAIVLWLYIGFRNPRRENR